MDYSRPCWTAGNNWLSQTPQFTRTALIIISIGEIYEVAFAYANPQEHLASFRQFLAPFRPLILNEPIMEQFGKIQAILHRRRE